MKYAVDHDYHIHSFISACAADPLQVPENILKCGKEHNYKRIILTDHFWDSSRAYRGKNLKYINNDFMSLASALPLPQAEGIEFLFGCETDMNGSFEMGIHEDLYDAFRFIIVGLNHFVPFNEIVDRNASYEERAGVFVKRLYKFLEFDLPFRKMGIAHITDKCIDTRAFEGHLHTLDLISDREFEGFFKGAKEKGLGIELNIEMKRYVGEDIQRVLRPYRIAKELGCKFYLGSDAHSLAGMQCRKEELELTVDLLGLNEEDKFVLE